MRRSETPARSRNLQREDDDERANGQHDQDGPPPLADEAGAAASPWLLADMRVLDVGLAGLALIETHCCVWIREDRLLVKTAKRRVANCVLRNEN